MKIQRNALRSISSPFQWKHILFSTADSQLRLSLRLFIYLIFITANGYILLYIALIKYIILLLLSYKSLMLWIWCFKSWDSFSYMQKKPRWIYEKKLHLFLESIFKNIKYKLLFRTKFCVCFRNGVLGLKG